MSERLLRHWPAVLVASGFCVAAVAIVAGGLWRVVPWERFALSLLLAAIAMALAWPLRRFARWSWPGALLVAWLFALVVFTGLVDVLAAGLLGVAALAIGLRLAPDGAGRWAIAVATGLGLVAGMAGWLVTVPIHHRGVWLLLLVALVAWQRVACLAALRALQAGWRGAVAAAPRWATLAAMLLGLASTACWLPTVQADDLAYHLGLPSQWLARQQYAPDAHHQVWAYAAWAGDVLHAVVAVLAGDHARGGLNALWLVAAAGAAWGLCARLGASPAERWASVALLAGFPPMVWLAAGMQTELPATALLLALAAVVVPGAGDDARRTWTAAILLGGLAAMKSTHLVAALPLLASAAWVRRGRDWPWRSLLVAAPVFAAVAGSSYWQAWQATGNPVLPLFNAHFGSAHFPLQDFDDPRWHAGFGPGLPWHLVVDTDRYLESWDGGLGVGLLALAGTCALALLRPGHRALVAAAALAVLLPLLPLQYARYAFPGLVLLMVVALPRVEAALGRARFAWAIAGLCMVNLAFQANSGWTQHSALPKDVVRHYGDPARVLARHAPDVALLAHLPPGDRAVVLATDPARNVVAGLAGRGRTVSWHAPRLAAAHAGADADPSGARWRTLFAGSKAHWILMTSATASPALHRALADAGARRVAANARAELWRLPGAAP